MPLTLGHMLFSYSTLQIFTDILSDSHAAKQKVRAGYVPFTLIPPLFRPVPPYPTPSPSLIIHIAPIPPLTPAEDGAADPLNQIHNPPIREGHRQEPPAIRGNALPSY